MKDEEEGKVGLQALEKEARLGVVRLNVKA